jgi:iron complex outermembrane recepter protein
MKMKKRAISIISVFFLSAFALNAQHTVSGLITDKTDNSKLLEGVSVYIPEFSRFDISKEGGTYILRNVGIGVVSIQFTRIGYKSVVKTISTKDSALVVHVEMEPSSVELQEVSVTGNNTKLPERIPYPVTDFQALELKKTGATNILTSLSYQPGIDRISMGNGINKPVIRGLSFNRILLHQYGTRIENQPWDDRHDIGINELGVEKVELIKGPAALIYGPDAMGGALIFVDEKPAIPGTSSGEVNTTVHSNTLGIDLDAGVKGSGHKGLFYTIRLGGRSHTSYLQGGGDEVRKNTEEDEFAFNSKMSSVGAKAGIGMSKKWGVSKLTYSYYHQLTGIIEIENDSLQSGVTNEVEEQREREIEAPNQDVTSNILSLENTIVTGKSKVNVNISYQLNDRKEFEPLPEKQKEKAIGLQLNTFTYDVKYSSDAAAKSGISIGTQGFIQTNRNNGLLGLVPDADITDFAGYFIFRYDIDKWNFLAGARADLRSVKIIKYIGEEDIDSLRPDVTTDRDYTLFNGSAGFAFHPSKKITLKLNFSTGFTAPNYAQLGSFGKHEGAFRFEKGNINLAIEQNGELDFGLIWESQTVTLNADAYYNMISNYIYISDGGTDTVYQSDTIPVFNYAQANAAIAGTEVGIGIHPPVLKWISLNASYGWLRGEFENGDFLPYIPANKLVTGIKISKARMNYVYDPYISIVYSKYSAQKNVSGFETATNGYDLLDLHFGGNFRWGRQYFSLTISANNLLDASYFNHLSLTKDLKPEGVHEMGRNISVALHIPFGLKHN